MQYPSPKKLIPSDLLRLKKQLQHSKLTPGPLVVGISGGLDSCALLHLLITNTNPQKNPLFPCYIAHGIRNLQPEIPGLTDYCSDLGLNLRIFHLPQGWLEKRHGLSLEDLARRERYRRLEYYAGKLQAKCIVLAHHADDQQEGLLMNLTRGSGPCGLAGMSEYSPRGDVLLWRPLLRWRRKDLQRWAEIYALPHWEDQSNFQQDHLRNFYRWQVLPQLKRLLPNWERGVQRSQEHLALVQDWLEEQRVQLEQQIRAEQSQKVLVWSGDFAVLPAPLQVELLYLLFDRIRVGEQRRRRLPFGFVRELQSARSTCYGHGCVWDLGPSCVRVTRES